MRPIVTLALTMNLCLLWACASTPKPPAIVDLKGFLVSRPSEEGWQTVTQTDKQLMLTKPGDFTGDAKAYQATVVVLPDFNTRQEFVRYAESTLRRELNPASLHVLKLKVHEVDIQGQACAMAHVEVAERAAPDGTGSPVNTMLESLTLTCPHPRNPTHGISSLYSHRHLPEDKDPAFERTGTTLVSSLKFGMP